MTATLTTVPSTTATQQATKTQPVWKAGLAAGLIASVATTAVVVVARAIDIPVADRAGESIPILGFAQMTLLCTAIGILLARVIGRRSSQFSRSNKSVGAMRDGDRPLGILAHGKAWDTEITRLLLQSAGIRNGQCSVFDQAHEPNITHRLDQTDIWR